MASLAPFVRPRVTMSCATAVMVGNAESEWARLGNAAMLGGGAGADVVARGVWCGCGVATVIAKPAQYGRVALRSEDEEEVDEERDSAQVQADGTEGREEAGDEESEEPDAAIRDK